MTDNNATELKPCPICGRKATIHSWWSNDEECGVASVGCSRESYTNGYECARIHIMRCDEKTARRDAIRIWNTRTPEQAALNKAAGNWAHADVLLRGLLEECESCPYTGCTRYIEEVVKPNLRTPEQDVTATLGVEECEAIRDKKTQTIVCSKCGGGGLNIPRRGQYALRNFCPNCGRKISR